MIPVTFLQARAWRDNESVSRLAVRNAPACTRGHANLGEALWWASQALELRPESVEMLEVAAEASRRSGDLAAAQRYLERRLDLTPNAAALSDLAILRWQAGDSQGALQLWRTATELPGTRAAIWLNLAQAYESLGQPEAAAAAYRQFLRRERGELPEVRAAAEGRLRVLTED
jgi:tetratricopeptide (TPR) repeat protein